MGGKVFVPWPNSLKENIDTYRSGTAPSNHRMEYVVFWCRMVTPSYKLVYTPH